MEGEGQIEPPLPTSANIPSDPSAQSQSFDTESGVESQGSEMFICKVINVEPGQGKYANSPLLHWRRDYVGVQGAEWRGIGLAQNTTPNQK